MKRYCFLVAAFLAPLAGGAEPTDGEVARIECQCTVEKLLQVFPKGESLRGTYHYDVWLPPGYSASGDRRYPCLFLTSPGGEARRMFGPYQEWMRRHEWMAVMLVESRNGVLLPAVANFLGAHDDAVKRFRILDGMKAAAGMSGGARISSLFVQLRKGFTGLFLQGAGFLNAASGRYFVADLNTASGVSIFLTMGEKDPNGFEVRLLLQSLPADLAFFPQVFAGGHTAPDASLTATGMDWLSRRMWQQAASQPIQRKAAAAEVRRLAATADSAATPAEKFRLMDLAGVLVKRGGLGSEASLTDILASLSKAFGTLRQDPAVRDEMAAASAVAKLHSAFQKAQSEAAKAGDAAVRNKVWETLAASYQAAAAEHPGAPSALEAVEFARALLFNPPPPSAAKP